MHCFGGTLEQALTYVGLGFMVSVACAITYPSSGETRRMAAGLALGSMLVETDSPYLPPQPRRGRRNEPAFVGAAIEAIASARAMEVERVAEATTANACRLFGVAIPALAGAA